MKIRRYYSRNPKKTPREMLEEQGYFGIVMWTREDLQEALVMNGYPAIENNIDELEVACTQGSYTIANAMIERGWDYLNDIIAILEQENKLEEAENGEEYEEEINMDFYISTNSDNGSGMSYKTKEDFLKEIELMIDDCIENGGSYFEVTVDSDASCYWNEDEEYDEDDYDYDDCDEE